LVELTTAHFVHFITILLRILKEAGFSDRNQFFSGRSADIFSTGVFRCWHRNRQWRTQLVDHYSTSQSPVLRKNAGGNRSTRR